MRNANRLELISNACKIVERWLASDGPKRKKLNTKGLDRSFVLAFIEMACGVVKYLQYILAGLVKLAEEPPTPCPTCKERQQLAAELLAGKMVGIDDEKVARTTRSTVL